MKESKFFKTGFQNESKGEESETLLELPKSREKKDFMLQGSLGKFYEGWHTKY